MGRRVVVHTKEQKWVTIFTVLTALGSLAVSVWALMATLDSVETNRETVRLAREGIDLTRAAQKASDINSLLERLPLAVPGKDLISAQFTIENLGLGPAQVYQIDLWGPISRATLKSDALDNDEEQFFEAFFRSNFPTEFDKVIRTRRQSAISILKHDQTRVIYGFTLDENARVDEIKAIFDKTNMRVCFADLTGKYASGFVNGDSRQFTDNCPPPDPIFSVDPTPDD